MSPQHLSKGRKVLPSAPTAIKPRLWDQGELCLSVRLLVCWLRSSWRMGVQHHARPLVWGLAGTCSFMCSPRAGKIKWIQVIKLWGCPGIWLPLCKDKSAQIVMAKTLQSGGHRLCLVWKWSQRYIGVVHALSTLQDNGLVHWNMQPWLWLHLCCFCSLSCSAHTNVGTCFVCSSGVTGQFCLCFH